MDHKETTKDKILNLLTEHSNSYISGQEIAKTLFLTRAAVWKAVKSLKEEGHKIDAISNRGYCLVTESKPLFAKGIERELSYARDRIEVIFLDETESTNEDAKRLGAEGYIGKIINSELKEISHAGPSGESGDAKSAPKETAVDKVVIVSDYQTKGKGRRGRSFLSPKGTGLYMSFLMHPDIRPEQAYMLTCAAGVAVSKAIMAVTGIKTSIKWVNDVFAGDKKICGILTEGALLMETGGLDYAVVGIGINVFAPKEGFPAELKDVAGALYENKEAPDNLRNCLAAAVIDNFLEITDKGGSDFVKEYRSLSNLIGHYVKVNPYGDTGKRLDGYAKVLDIDDECRLIVEYENGTKEALSSGEVSVKKY